MDVFSFTLARIMPGLISGSAKADVE